MTAATHGYAQTVLQLQSQLVRAGARESERRYLLDAYRLAADLFSGQYRGSEKTFVAHLVGTASILLAHGESIELAAAGLLHATYELGDFGHGLTGSESDERSELRRVIGFPAEAYVYAYAKWPWSDQAVAALDVAALGAAERDLLAMRLANELEDHLDLSLHFCANAADRLERLVRMGDRFAALARALGKYSLAEELVRMVAENRAARVPATLRSHSAHGYLRLPRSSGRRVAFRLRAQVSRWRQLLR